MNIPTDIREESVKLKVADFLFKEYDCTDILGDIDFTVKIPHDPLRLIEDEYLYWAEAKRSNKHDIYESVVQLIITIGKERPQDKFLPPTFIGAYDAVQIAFMPYHTILDVLVQNDFNWNVRPSDHTTKEFRQLYNMIQGMLDKELMLFQYHKDEKELKKFIKKNFHFSNTGVNKVNITKNNFTTVYQKWTEQVKPTIAVHWDEAKADGIIDADFFLADLMSKDNATIREKLNVLLKNDRYIFNKKMTKYGAFNFDEVIFTDHQKAYTKFWNKYVRPPRKEYWEFMITRRDLLVPQDIREVKGAYFTPRQWVELSQQYLADTLGENWQEEYYIWDCAAGTGNLLAGLTNPYNIYASTIDKADVDTMHDRIQAMNAAGVNGHGSNLLDEHVFEFDFLNDPFDAEHMPQSLLDIVNDKDRRKKLVIYINPPFKEVSGKIERNGKKGNKGVNKSLMHDKYQKLMGCASREVFAFFLMRIFKELNGCIIGNFSKVKLLSGASSNVFRNNFTPYLKRMFVVHASTFDNVTGNYPIGFFIWDTSLDAVFYATKADVYNKKCERIGVKTFKAYNKQEYISTWTQTFRNITKECDSIGFLDGTNSNDMQHNTNVYIKNSKSQIKNPRGYWIGKNNLSYSAVYMSIRHVIEFVWLNDRDQYTVPHHGWECDNEFVSNSLCYTLFDELNVITSFEHTNHWIPFSAQEMGARDRTKSTFMYDFIHGRLDKDNDIFADDTSTQPIPNGTQAIAFTQEAQEVMDAALALFRYYHKQENSNPDASYYDIRLHFQGTTTDRHGKTKMNSSSNDEEYNRLLTVLKEAHKKLGDAIRPKVYEYGFLEMDLPETPKIPEPNTLDI